MNNFYKIFFCLYIATINAAEFSIYDIEGKSIGKINCTKNSECIQKAFSKTPKATVLVKKNSIILTPKILAESTISKDSLHLNMADTTLWIELEKNNIKSICLDDTNGLWNVHNLAYRVESKNCLQIHTGSFVKDAEIKYISKNTLSLHLLIDMKLVDLSATEHELGYYGPESKFKEHTVYLDDINKTLDNLIFPDPIRKEKIDEILVVNKYKVTNCDFIQTLWDSIPNKSLSKNDNILRYHNYWIQKKRKLNSVCDIHDSAAIKIYLYHALSYANARSIRDGYTPVYSLKIIRKRDFSPKLNKDYSFGTSTASFFENYKDFVPWIKVYVNNNANGYRLPFYDEWMALAKAKSTGIKYVWGNSEDKSFAAQYAWFGAKKILDERGVYTQESRPVGMLKPNSYGLYDIAGIVCENVTLPGKSIFNEEITTCKGGFLTDSLQNLNFGAHEDNNYTGYGGFQGLRLVRKIKIPR